MLGRTLLLGRTPRRLSGLLLTVAPVLVIGCGRPTEPRGREMARLVVQANVAATTVATLVITVSAPDINPALVFNLPISGAGAAGPIEIPAGSNRRLQLEAFDANNVKTHEGEKTIAVVRAGNVNAPITVQLNPIPGQQPVTVTFGNYSVAVSGTVNVLVGQTTQLSATVTDAEGKTVSGAAVQWATSNPAFATVDATGLVTGIAAGAVKVMATYKGVGGEVTITVN